MVALQRSYIHPNHLHGMKGIIAYEGSSNISGTHATGGLFQQHSRAFLSTGDISFVTYILHPNHIDFDL